MIRRIRQLIAIHRLNKLVRKQRESFACQDYARRRAAALKHTRGAC